METGRVTAQAIISLVCVSVSSSKIAGDTMPIFLVYVTAVYFSYMVLVVHLGCPVSVNLQHIPQKGTLGNSAECQPPNTTQTLQILFYSCDKSCCIMSIR